MATSLWSLGGLSWAELGKRVYNEVVEDEVLDSAAQLAYYFLFALFPLLIFLTSIFGFVVGTNNELRNELFLYLGSVLPGSALDLVRGVIEEVSQSSSGGKISLGLLLALWAASSGLQAVTQSLNRAYDVKESRPWWKLRLTAIGLTVGLALTVISALIIILFGGHFVDYAEQTLGFGAVLTTVWAVVQYVIALCFVLLGFALIYYFSPDLKEHHWFFVTPGSVVGVGLWLLISFGFRIYLSYFNSYSATYGSLGALIILLLWLYFTGLAILIGGEINSEIENAAAEAGAPEAKEKGEKAPDENETLGAAASKNDQKAEADRERQPEEKKKPVEAEIIPPNKKQVWATRTAVSQPTEKKQEHLSLPAKVAAIGSMIVGVFMSFGGSGSGGKNEKER
ncbi:MAG: YihY/virulence factor BrkB family protein [Acidobacteriota bacterium]|nr:YihY/virulence factor BrkB family protein [Acidobacteriota bacterium]